VADIQYAVESARSYGPGLDPFRIQEAPNPRAGDFYLTSQEDHPRFPPVYAGIRLAQLLRYRGKWRKFAHWNHAGIFVDDAGTVVEALGKGAVKRNISSYRPEEYTVVHLDMSDDDRAQVAHIAESWVGAGYGYMTIVNIGMRLVFGGKLSYSRSDQKICSGLVATCLQAAGYSWRGYDTNRMMPADLAWLADVSYEEAQ